MSKYTENQLEYIKEKVSIEEVVETITGEVPENGKILCPNREHDDTDPSFSIEDQVGHCFSCDYSGNLFKVVMELKEINFLEAVNWIVKEFSITLPDKKEGVKRKQVKKKKKTPKALITKREYDKIREESSMKGDGYRGINDETLKKIGVRTEYNEDGVVTGRWYPITENDKPACMKKRITDPQYLEKTGKSKGFAAVGRLGENNDLFGSTLCRNGGKIALIVGGEEDLLAAQQMIDKAWKKFKWSKGTKPKILSPTIGETECYKQIEANYGLLNKFDEIIIGFDNDDAGKKATEKIISSLPKKDIYYIEWSEKDPNDYLINNKEEEFIQDYWKKKKWIPVGLVSSDGLRKAAIEEIGKERITLPKFMQELEKMLGASLTQGRIINLAAETKGGKTTIVNEINYHLYFYSPYLPLTVTLELSKGQYAIEMYSRHLGINISGMTQKEQLKVLKEKDKEITDLEVDENGNPRFILLDDRDGTIDDLKAKIEEAIISVGVGVVVFDPLSDVFDGLDLKEAEKFIKWQKSCVKSHNVIFINIVHINKSSQGTFFNDKGELQWPRGDVMHGSSTLAKSGTANIYLARNKISDDPVERNTTYVLLKDNRVGRVTGPAGKWFYDMTTHTMHDFNNFWENKAEEGL